MPIVAFGLNHHSAPLALLERVALPADQLPKLVSDLCDGEVVRGAVVVATCHRLELYLDAERFHDSFRVARNVLAIHTGTAPAELADHFLSYFDNDAAQHLFEVAAGLDSAVLGEHEILGQLRSAWELSVAETAASGALNLLFRRAIEAGKRVRTDTALGRGTASISHAAIELAEATLGSLAGNGCSVLVLGAGEMGSGVAISALGAGAGAVAVCNRSAERAAELVERLGDRASAVSWADVDEALARADLVVTSTGADEAVIGAEQLRGVMAGRGDRPLVVVDVAMPRDVEPAAALLDGVTLLDLDDLRRHAETGLADRMGAVNEARAIVVDSVDRYVAERSSRLADPVVAALRTRAEELRAAELERQLPRLAELNEKELEAVAAVTKAVLAKLLHRPTVVLKDAAGSPRGARLAEAAAELFDLDS